MEDDVRKKGALFLQQHRFGKRWRKVWCVLFRESLCSVSRLEIYDWNERSDRSVRNVRKHQDNKKVIRLSSCIHISSVDVDGAPKDTSSFLIETTEKIFVFAADRLQADEWTQRLCEIAFPMNWADSGLHRASSQRNTRSEPHLGQSHGGGLCMEDNSLYSQREPVGVQDFRVVVRRTEASERCRLKGEAMLRADSEALLLLDRSGLVLFSWPYRYLRRFGRDKSTFSFEAGRRCDSGEGSFEFDTKLGNALFVAVETAINCQRLSLPPRQSPTGLDSPAHMSRPQRQTSLGLDSHSPISRSLPPRPEEPDPVYSLVNEANLQLTHKDRESSSPSQRHHLFGLEPPVDKALTAVKSLTLENRDPPLHRKNQVKPISSCPLLGDHAPSAADHAPTATGHTPPTTGPVQTYSEITPVRKKKSKSQGSNGSLETSRGVESEYSLPFDLLIPDLRELGGAESERTLMADPLYDSIDDLQIRNIFHSHKTDKIEHIYDEPEGCQHSGLSAESKMASAAASLYDEPEEMRGEAWRIMGTEQDPKGHEFPYNPRVDDYAVPKRAQRAFSETQTLKEPEERQNQGLDRDLDQELDQELDQALEEEPEDKDSPYSNFPAKMDNKLS